MENKIEELIRDITKVGFMPKSEARRRIEEVALAERERIIGIIQKYSPYAMGCTGCRERTLKELKSIIKLIKE